MANEGFDRACEILFGVRKDMLNLAKAKYPEIGDRQFIISTDIENKEVQIIFKD